MTALLCLTGVAFAATSMNDDVDFARDVLPILSDNCFRCHGPDQQTREADLRLDTKEGAMRTEDAIIVPGHADKSELVRRVLSTDPDEAMPPPDSNRQLNEQQKQTLREWIESGAEWGRHWSFVKPNKPTPPRNDDEWIRTDIDRFVLNQLVAKNMRPMPAADRRTLIRRVSLDLTGLPPTLAEFDAFASDKSPDAWE